MSEFSLVLRTETCLNHCQEPDEFITEHRGLIRYTRPKDDRTFRAGLVRAYRVHAALAAREEVRLADVFRTFSGQMERLFRALYDPATEELLDAVAERLGEIGPPDVLVLDYILLHPRWRGLKIGHVVARRLIDLLGDGCGLVVTEVRPLRREAADTLRVPAAWIPEPADASTGDKLRRYATRLGFRSLRGTDYFGMALAADD